MESILSNSPKDGCLQVIMEVIQKHYGAVLIFGDVVSGFHYDLV